MWKRGFEWKSRDKGGFQIRLSSRRQKGVMTLYLMAKLSAGIGTTRERNAYRVKRGGGCRAQEKKGA